ncbi:MAG: TonB-dependent receptor [Hyphomicrobiaceae bacterium]|nr:TonB-dependent receptor [Hyphomicrobiaceae bacterium]
MALVWLSVSVRRRPLDGALLAAAMLGLPQVAAAQTVLPGIVVEGATLSRPAPRRAQVVEAAPAEAPGATETGSAQGGGGSSTGGWEAAATAANGSPTSDGGHPSETVGSSVSVVTAAELERQQVRTAGDALRSLPGVSVNHAGSPAGQTQVRLRGAEANHTLVMIDGIVANQPGTGEFDFSNLPADQIERIEVVRGAQSGLYGSGAIGGVVNIVTKRGRGPGTATVWGEVGSYKTVESGVSVSGGSERAHGLISYSVRNTNGHNISIDGTETDAAQHRSFILKGGVAATRDLSVDVIVRNVDKRGDRDGDLFALSGLSRQTDTFSHFASNVWLAGIEAKHLAFDGRLEQRVKYSYASTVLEDTDIGAFGTFYARNDNERRNAAYLATLHLGSPALAHVLRHSLTGLVEHETELFNQVTGDNLTRERNRLATAAEYRAEILDRLTVTGNVRHDDNDVFDDFTTWRAAASLAIRELGLRPHASYGTGIKLPTMVEQFGQFAGFVPNPGLQAEASQGWDAGVEVSLAKGAIVVDATYFKANLENEIVTRFLPFFQSTVENLAGESTRRGIELSARWRPLAWASLGGAYTWLDARDDRGQREIRRAPDTGRVDATLAFHEGRGSVTVAAAYNGRMHDLAFGLPTFETVRVVLDDYWLATIAARYKLTPGVEIFGRVENAFDARYQEIYGFETAGPAVYAGLKLTFGGEVAPR